MKRFDPAYERMLAELPGSAAALRYVNVLVGDPEFEPFFGERDRPRPDVPRTLIEATARAEREQVEEAVGSGDPDTVRAFSESYLGSWCTTSTSSTACWRGWASRCPRRWSTAAGGTKGGRSPARCGLRTAPAGTSPGSSSSPRTSTAKRSRLFFDDSVRSLHFPSPWQKNRPTVYRRTERRDGVNAVAETTSYEEAFARELDHFHACVAGGEACRTPPEQARLDIEVLTAMFLASRA